jgi:hypothetical protein
MVSVIKPWRQSYSEFASHVVAPCRKFLVLYEARLKVMTLTETIGFELFTPF